MPDKIFVNLPVRDLPRSKDFFSRLGFHFEARFTDENAACLVLGPNIFAMLLATPFFQTFTARPVCDATKATEAILCLGVATRKEADDLHAAVREAGGSAVSEPEEREGMYGFGFADLDGHLWEVLHLSDDTVPLD